MAPGGRRDGRRGQASRTMATYSVDTTSGADAAIGDGQTRLLETSIRQAVQLRVQLAQAQSPTKVAEYGLALGKTYQMLHVICSNSSPHVFWRIPDSQHVLLVKHFNKVFGQVARSPKWQTTGDIEKWDRQLLECFFSWPVKLASVQVLLDAGFLPALAGLVHARQPLLPRPKMCSTVCAVVMNVIFALSKHGTNETSNFRRMIDDDIMGEYLRCLTSPGHVPMEMKMQHLPTLDAFRQQFSLIRKYVKRGQPMGDMLAGLVSGGRGSMHRAVYSRLMNLVHLADLMDDVEPRRPSPGHCHQCGKQADSLLICSNCRDAFYCSTKCQRADWKEHKLYCKEEEVVQQVLMAFCQRHYAAIAKELLAQSARLSKPKHAFLLEVDLWGDDSLAPGLMNPPRFKIGLIQSYVEGNRPAEPDWFGKGTHQYRANIDTFLRECRSHVPSDNFLLVLARWQPSGFGICPVRPLSHGTPIFSTAALEGFAAGRSIVEEESWAVAMPQWFASAPNL